jgi:O-antigen ligase
MDVRFDPGVQMSLLVKSNWLRLADFEGRKGCVSLLLVGGVVASLTSVFVSSLLFVLGGAVWIWDCCRDRRLHLEMPPFKSLMFAFLALVLISILFSSDRLASALYLKKLLKYFLVFLLYTYLTREQIAKGVNWIFLVVGASAAWGIGQYFWFKNVDLLNRIDGFMSHWMTFSGQLMICAVALAAYLVYLWKAHALDGWWQRMLFLCLPIILLALLLTMTRSAWIGLAGGLFVLIASFRFRWIAVGAGVALLMLVFLPSSFKVRLYSGFDLTDVTTRGRIEIFETGLRLVAANPLTGVGPRMVAVEAAGYRQEQEFPEWAYQHFHNNVIQIAAESGIPALLVWLGLWLWIACDLLGVLRRGSKDLFTWSLALMTFCVIVAFHLMGLLEYNAGDSEVATLMIFFVSASYAVRRQKEGEDRAWHIS